MAKVAASFDQFAIGDYTYFQKKFTLEDFKAFSSISGDSNELHHDSDVAAESGYEGPIVPLHLTIAPLSRIAGMLFPGPPSLYITHRVKAIKPVFYDQQLTYSARISAINKTHRVLSINVLAWRENEVVLTAEMQVQAREGTWSEPEGIHRYTVSDGQTALITGASGAIGAAIAINLARRGYKLLLHGNSNKDALQTLANKCKAIGVETKSFLGPLDDDQSVNELGEWSVSDWNPNLVVHAACPPLHSKINQLVAVNYSALRVLMEIITPCFLRRQSGDFVLVSSTAVKTNPVGWQDYVAAKAMATSLVSGFHQRNSQYGIHGIVIAPGYVKSRFSQGLFPADLPAMLPEEVAENVTKCLSGPLAGKTYYEIGPGGIQAGHYDFQPARDTQSPVSESGTRPTAEAIKESAKVSPAAPSDISHKLRQLFRTFFNASSDEEITKAALGVTASWDSLRHIELLLLLENEFSTSFTSDEINQTQDFRSIQNLLLTKCG